MLSYFFGRKRYESGGAEKMVTEMIESKYPDNPKNVKCIQKYIQRSLPDGIAKTWKKIENRHIQYTARPFITLGEAKCTGEKIPEVNVNDTFWIVIGVVFTLWISALVGFYVFKRKNVKK